MTQVFPVQGTHPAPDLASRPALPVLGSCGVRPGQDHICRVPQDASAPSNEWFGSQTRSLPGLLPFFRSLHAHHVRCWQLTHVLTPSLHARRQLSLDRCSSLLVVSLLPHLSPQLLPRQCHSHPGNTSLHIKKTILLPGLISLSGPICHFPPLHALGSGHAELSCPLKVKVHTCCSPSWHGACHVLLDTRRKYNAS